MSTTKPLMDKEESCRIHIQIRRVLLEVWDPIGIRDEPQAQDEYDSYISDVYRLLVQRASSKEIANYLYDVAHNRMGFDAAQIRHMSPTVKALQEISITSDLSAVSGRAPHIVRWPTALWKQASIALFGAVVASIWVFSYTNDTHSAQYAKQYPHDGQDGLSALMDAARAGAGTFLGVSIGLFAVQRMVRPSKPSLK